VRSGSCADRVLYGVGTNGFSACDVVDGKPSAFHDNLQEGDPVLNWDIALGSMALVGKEGDSEWSAELTVSP